MEIVQFPDGRALGRTERLAFAQGLARHVVTARPRLRLIAGSAGTWFCASCATPVDIGASWMGAAVYCSVECSPAGDRPA